MIETLSASASFLVALNTLVQHRKIPILYEKNPTELTPDDITIAIPARNEERNLKELLPQIFSQDFLPSQILILDDASLDGTKNLLDFFAKHHSQLEILSGKALEAGWSGKVWACQQLFERAKNPYVIFIDCDVRLPRKDSLRTLLAWSEPTLLQGGFSSVFPRPKVSLPSSALVLPVFFSPFQYVPFFSSLKAARKMSALGCGQVMQISRDSLGALHGFCSIKSSTHDGLLLARTFAGHNLPTQWFAGDSFCQSETYPSLKLAFKGFSRNLFEVTPKFHLLFAMCALEFLVFLAPLFFWREFLRSPVWVASWIALGISQAILHRRFDRSIVEILGLPIRVSCLLAAQSWSFARKGLGLSITWHGRILGSKDQVVMPDAV